MNSGGPLTDRIAARNRELAMERRFRDLEAEGRLTDVLMTGEWRQLPAYRERIDRLLDELRSLQRANIDMDEEIAELHRELGRRESDLKRSRKHDKRLRGLLAEIEIERRTDGSARGAADHPGPKEG